MLTVDLQSLDVMSAPSVAVLAAAALEVAARGVLADGSRIVLPRDPTVQERLNTWGVLRLLAGWSSDDPRDQAPTRGWCPCQLFGPHADPGRAAQALAMAIADACETELSARHVIWYTLNELGKNVVDHSCAEAGAIGVADVTTGGTEVEVAIADFGIGIRSSLSRNPAHASISEIEALHIAVSLGGSSRVEPPGPVGLGLYFTQLILQDNGGHLLIRSGGAELVVGSGASEESALEHMQGTLLILRFRTDRPVRLDSILPQAA